MANQQHPCSFCAELKSAKEAFDFYQRKGYTTEYKAALITQSFYRGDITGQSTHSPVVLNFCPECGNDLRPILAAFHSQERSSDQ